MSQDTNQDAVLKELASPVMTYTHDGQPVTLADLKSVRYVYNLKTGNMELRKWKPPKAKRKPKTS